MFQLQVACLLLYGQRLILPIELRLLTCYYAVANNMQMNFKTWVNEQRGRSAAVAKTLGITQPVVSDWVTGKKSIPAERCKAIERMSGGLVTCKEMRPFDWHKYWPELAELPATQAQAAINTVARQAA